MNGRRIKNKHLRRFYYLEARLLDQRRFDQWLNLLCEDIVYTMPANQITAPDPALRGQHAPLARERDLSRYSASESPLREENYFTLALRADRHTKLQAWAEHPPALTRRLIGNIEACQPEELFADLDAKARAASDGAARSNFLLHFFRHGQAVLYAGERRDLLRVCDGALKLARREVVLDVNIIEPPGAGLLF